MPTTDDFKTRFERNIKASRAILALLKKIEVMDQSHVVDLQAVSTALDQIRKAMASLPLEDSITKDLNDWINLRTQRLDNDKNEFADKFSSQLASLLKADGLDLTGQYPDLRVKYYTIEVDFAKSLILIWYGPKQELMSRMTKFNAEETYKTLKLIDKNLCGSDLDEPRFLQEVYDAYSNNVSKRHVQEGDKIEILAVLKEITFIRQDGRFNADPRKDNFKEYGRASFSYDLSRLSIRQVGTKTLTLDVATRTNTASKSGFIWIPSGSRDGFACAYLAFKETP